MVEGYHDLARLKSIYRDIDVIITNGSEISDATLAELKELNAKRGLILFLDPDYQGERIRRMINDHVGETKHAFLLKKDCISRNKKKIGIEHASKIVIMEQLDKYHTSNIDYLEYNMNDMLTYKLMGSKDSKILRKKVCESLGIGLCNAKSLVKKLNMFGIERNTLEASLEE